MSKSLCGRPVNQYLLSPKRKSKSLGLGAFICFNNLTLGFSRSILKGSTLELSGLSAQTLSVPEMLTPTDELSGPNSTRLPTHPESFSNMSARAGFWKCGDLEIHKFGVQKIKKIKILKIQFRSAKNVGKVWISRKKNILLAPFAAIPGHFIHGPNKIKNT